MNVLFLKKVEILRLKDKLIALKKLYVKMFSKDIFCMDVIKRVQAAAYVKYMKQKIKPIQWVFISEKTRKISQ